MMKLEGGVERSCPRICVEELSRPLNTLRLFILSATSVTSWILVLAAELYHFLLHCSLMQILTVHVSSKGDITIDWNNL